MERQACLGFTTVENIGLLQEYARRLLEDVAFALAPVGTPGNTFTPTTPTFTCAFWNNTIKPRLLEQLTNLRNTLDSIMGDTSTCPIEDYGYLSQLSRLRCVIDSLINRVTCICCDPECQDLVGDLLCLIVQLVAELIAIIIKLSTLEFYRCNTCDDTTMIRSFFNCLVCEFVNEICSLEDLSREINALIVAFATCNIDDCTPCYVASCTPKKKRPICPPKFNKCNCGFNHPPQNQGGCDCNFKPKSY